MFDRYQSYAKSMNSRVVRSQNVPVGQTFNPGQPYQAWANTFNTKMIHSDDPRVPNTPVQDMADDWQDQANGMLDRIRNSDDLQLSGLRGSRGLGSIGPFIRPSGSLARAVRMRGLGDAAPSTTPATAPATDPATACAGFDYEKWLEPVAGFIYASADFQKTGSASGATTDAAVKQFGQAVVTCVLYGMANGQTAKLTTADGARLLAAGQKMYANGWWDKSNWSFYWTYRSGWTPFYRNPLYLGGFGLVAAAGTWLYMRHKKH